VQQTPLSISAARPGNDLTFSRTIFDRCIPYRPSELLTMRMQELSVGGKDYVIAPLFNLCMALFQAAIPFVRPDQRTPLKEEKNRLALWGDGFGDTNLDQLFDRKPNDRYQRMIVILLGSVINQLDNCQYTQQK
jgi:hypothetical protein